MKDEDKKSVRTTTRTTVRLDPLLMQNAKRLVSLEGKTLTAVIAEALEQRLAKSRAKSPIKKQKVTLPTVDLGQPLSGVGLDDSAGLLDLMKKNDFT